MKYLTMIVAFLCLTSCVNQGAQKTTGKEETVLHEPQAETVTLDNGKKWKANFATTKGVLNMKYILETVNKDSKVEDYRLMGTKLQKEYQNIFKNCDMTGEAHNQLHNYLLPMSEWFKTFQQGDLNECRSALDSFKKHLEEYDLYFK